LLSRYSLGMCLAVPLILLLPAGPASTAEPSAAESEFFEKHVRPILIEKCLKCHGEAEPKARLKLTSRDSLLKGGKAGPAIVLAEAEQSLLLRAVRYDDKPRMPPDGKLSDRQIEVLSRWVKMGVPWPGPDSLQAPVEGGFTITEKQRRFWAFQPVKCVALPEVRDRARAKSSIDLFILSALEAKGLGLAKPADKRTLLRRATFDLIGLPPSPVEIDAFLADESPDAFARVVDRLLASPHYGERWGRHWLDVVRFADARDLIQLPPGSDFREAWRYRDWVVQSFNRDLPYTDFIRAQVAGDLLPPPEPGGINKDGLVATGMLAIADFVPGDVDKDQMIADYVNDQIDVVGRSFLGLSLACARCHDHKFDPISTRDYYALAGIFFSSRIIPGPVAGNTPLVRVPLMSAAEIAEAKARDSRDKRRRAELERVLSDGVDREYQAQVKRFVTAQFARYLVAACEYRKQTAGPVKPAPTEFAKKRELHEGILAGWVAYLNSVEKQSLPNQPRGLRDAAAGRLTGAELQRTADDLQKSINGLAQRTRDADAGAPERHALARDSLLRFRADDPYLQTDSGGRVTLWPNRAGLPGDAKPLTPGGGPIRTTAVINGHTKPVVRFDGKSLLQAPRRSPPGGSLFVVFKNAEKAAAGQRLVGWEDSDVGQHGLGLICDPDGRIHAILRNNGQPGDIVDARRQADFEVVCVSWGPDGAALHRDDKAVGLQTSISAISSDPGISSMTMGGPGSGASERFQGDVAEVRVYSRPLSEEERRQVQGELRDAWFKPDAPDAPQDTKQNALAALYEELLSPRGPFWVGAEERNKLLPDDFRARLHALSQELETLRKKPPAEIPEAVAVQDGGPKGTRHEGFKDATIYLRGNPKRPGETVPRGLPRILAGEHQERIINGSGRLRLADWLATRENPLTARVMVNRIWQHHFGEGLVRTPNDFGERGERPTHPELLDYLAKRFVESGWSVKSLHRLILSSATYQQSSHVDAAALARDPENRLIGRMNRRPLEAEAIRDSLLAVAGRLDATPGGPPFKELAVPRRTLYLLSARTGTNTSDFSRLFDGADPGSMVARRGQSTVAPQALFFMNDPFVTALARDLAARVAREAAKDDEARIRRLYALAFGRPPTRAELDLGAQILAPGAGPHPWDRYCHLILCTNEFVYLD
jgi:hypothetical protein